MAAEKPRESRERKLVPLKQSLLNVYMESCSCSSGQHKQSMRNGRNMYV
jgi:hypothetical protein